MKFIITSTGDKLESKFDMRFGRSQWFCLWDSKEQKAGFVENSYKNLNGGAGTKAAELAAELNVEKVISGDFGPKAKSLLEQLNIQMITVDSPEKTVGEVIASII
jgi:predicted Fe-Mo cluster-binding NifX family protein